MKAFTLLELLLVIVIITILTSLSLPTLSRCYRSSRDWLASISRQHTNRIEAFLRDETSQKNLEYYSTNRIEKWDNYYMMEKP